MGAKLWGLRPSATAAAAPAKQYLRGVPRRAGTHADTDTDADTHADADADATADADAYPGTAADPSSPSPSR